MMNLPHVKVSLSAVITAQGDLVHFPKLEKILHDSQHRSIELIIVVNTSHEEGSRFLNRLRESVEQYSNLNVKVFSYPNKSPGDARNFGEEKSTQDWITYWDYDDIPNVTKYLEMTAAAIKLNCDVICGGYYQTNYLDPYFVTKHPESFRDYNLPKQRFYDLGLWRYVFRRSALGVCKFEDFSMGEDQIFLLENRVFRDRVVVYSEYVYTYVRGMTGQLTSSKKAMNGLKGFLGYLNKRINTFAEAEEIKFAKCMYIKQCLTGLRRGDIRLKSYSLLALLRHYKFIFDQDAAKLIRRRSDAY